MGDSVYRQTLSALAEAPFTPGCWDKALNGLAQLCRASSSQMLSFGRGYAPVVIAPGFTEDDIGAFAALGGADPVINKGVAQILRALPDQIFADYQYMSDDERRGDILYNEFFKPHDGDYASFGVLGRDGPMTTVINLFHRRGQGPLNAADRRVLERVMPAFAKAAKLQSLLEDQAAAIAIGALDTVNAAVLLCDMDGRVGSATARAQAMLRRGDIFGVHQGCIRAHQPDASAALAAALRNAARAHPPPQSDLLVVRARDGMPVRLDIAPLPSDRGAAALRPMALVHIQAPTRSIHLDTGLVMKAFGLTPAEAAVAEGLCCGLTSTAIAALRGVAIETVQSQVKAVLAKTGARRRAEVPKLLAPFHIF